MRGIGRLLGMACVVTIVAGCGGGGGPPGVPAPPDAPTVETGEITVGPFVMRPAAATSMQVQTLPTKYGNSFAVFSGVTIDYVAIRELMDRVVFSSPRSGSWQLHTCDFFGDNLTQITFNSQIDSLPAWSPDGTQMAWTYHTATMGTEILVRPANGGPATHLSNNAADDEHPTWSPDGRWIAFETDRQGDWDIYKMLVDGSNQRDLIGDGAGILDDVEPDWSPNDSEILFMSNRTGPHRLYRMNADGTSQTALGMDGRDPAWHPLSKRFAFRDWVNATLHGEIYTARSDGTQRDLLVSSAGGDENPCYSSDGRYLFFDSSRDGSQDIWAKQTSFPYRLHQITEGGGPDMKADLGSPTVQISRTLIGPSGSDHGHDPIHDAAVAGVVAFNSEGYLNFVRLGIPPASGASLTATPLEETGVSLVGVILSAPNMYYIEEDAGIGLEPIMWDFTGATSHSALLYLDSNNGKLVTVVDMGDSIHSAAATDAPAVVQQATGSGLTVHGDFRRVYDAHGELVAEGDVETVEISAADNVVRAF